MSGFMIWIQEPRIWIVIRIATKKLSIVSCTTPHPSQKFHQNPFTTFFSNLTDRQTVADPGGNPTMPPNLAMAYTVVNWFSGKLVKLVPPDVRF